MVNERNGIWGKATPVPGLNPSEFARLRTLECTSAGNCSAAGSCSVGKGQTGWVVSEKNDTWGKAIQVPGVAALNGGGIAQVASISCASPGNCAVGGTYKTTAFLFQGYVASEKNGTWGKAIEVPGLGTLTKGGNVGFVLVSCPTAGNCIAGGNYQVTKGEDGTFNAFVASETKGVWGKATQLPGLNTLNFGSSPVEAIACPSLGHCTAGGSYEDRGGGVQAFVVGQR